VDETEKFYKSKDFLDRPPSIMVAEFEKMQQEAFQIQRDLYMKIQDMRMLDLSKDKIEDILVDAGMNKKLVRNLMDGEFTPIPYSKPRFETKVKTLKDLAKFKTEKSKNFTYNIKESWVYPDNQLDNVKDNWEDKKFFPRKFIPLKDADGNVMQGKDGKLIGKWEGGYKPELEGAITNDKGRVVYDENGKIKREPTFLEKAVPYIKDKISPFSGLMGQRSQAPLPPTSMPDQQLVASAPQINQQTGLTHSENALLSNEEKAIKLRSKGMA
jgi:hypothetical protein